MSEIVYCKDCAYAEPNNLDAYNAVKSGVFCTRYNQNTAGIYGCDNGKPKAKTNADRIRAMTDEEMAKFMERTKFYVCKKVAEICGIYNLEEHWDKDGIVKEEIEWLKQEAET